MSEWMEMMPEAVAELEFHSSEFRAGRRRFGPWTWGHLADGFYGFRCTEIRQHPALTSDDLIYLWRLSKCCRVLAEPDASSGSG
eukprot:1172056-Alexandrium_andersonii.AAC.1